MESTKYFKNWSLPRIFFPEVGWDDIQHIEIHGFCDASMDGYGTVVYFRIRRQDKYHVSFVTAKGRASPVQRVTLPRLELLSALLCARLVNTIVNELELSKKSYQCFYWTDSMVAWHWIKSDPYTLNMWVSNRVSAIQLISDPSSWYHCPGT